MAMRSSSFQALGTGGFHRIAYTEWGEAANPRVLLCVHGLTRNGRDFDYLARRLQGRYRVVCPDIVGRGKSDWLATKMDYATPQYCADMAALIARLGVEAVDWLGTSMGGIIGMALAAMPGTPIRRLVLNDVGPLVPRAALVRIAGYVGTDPAFADRAEAEAYFRTVMAPFGPLTDGQWRHIVRHGLRRDAGGGWRLGYDPAIGAPFHGKRLQKIDMWPIWDRIACPTLVIRGAESDLLLPRTLREMAGRGPGTEVVELAGVGHAPALMSAAQIDLVGDWLD